MPQVKINGTAQPVRQKLQVSYDPVNGLQIGVPFVSAGNNCNGLVQQLISNRVAFEWQPSGCMSRVVARASGGQAGVPNLSVDEWQLTANEIQKDLFEHPTSLAIDADQIHAIKKGLEDHTPSEQLSIDGNAIVLYDLLTRGTTHFALGQYVLRHSTNVSNDYSVNVADFNVERIYTTAQLIAEVTNPTSWVFPLPGRLVYKINNLAAPPARAGYLWGWRKLPSTEHTAAGNRIAITTEYSLEQWSTYIYQTV